MKNEKLAAVRGMNDLLPAEAPLWEWFEARVVDWLRSYGYRQIRTPIVEYTELFVKGIGEVTDIVEKEMYSFVDQLNGEHLTLRPEFTAGVVRAAIEHNLTYEAPRRVWSMGPVFRHERPQRGRYRQFYQVNVEALGFAGPDIDAEMIVMLDRLWKILGIGPVRLQLNCLGQADERARHREALVAHFERHAGRLDEDARRRLHSNPLRILDTKNPAMRSIVEAAPRLTDFLGAESLMHFERLETLLRAQNIPFSVNPRLVRGLDYYNLTVFEWVADGLTVCGGGRYDPLVEMLGGRAAPACGFALGVERVLELMRRAGEEIDDSAGDVYIVHQGDAAQLAAFQAAERLRDAGLDVVLHCGGGGFKAQFRRADASGAFLAVVLGEDELAAGEATLKWLRGERGAVGAGRQERVALATLPETVIDAITAGDED